MYYFGPWRSEGHHFFGPGGSSVSYSEETLLPWGRDDGWKVDGGLCPQGPEVDLVEALSGSAPGAKKFFGIPEEDRALPRSLAMGELDAFAQPRGGAKRLA
jgi:hypothetical protein